MSNISGDKGCMALNVKQVATRGDGRHADSNGLYLFVRDSSRLWTMLYTFVGKRKEMSFGSAGVGGLSLAQARAAVAKAREQINAGTDPLAARVSEKAAHEKKHAPVTFAEAATEFIETRRSSWKNQKHATMWTNSLATHCTMINDMPLAEITTEHVLKVLKPIWKTKAETASRIRGRIEAIFDAAKVHKLCAGENPARWKGHLGAILPARNKLQRGHHAAMPFDNVPAYLVSLREKNALSALALEFTILTACRTSEVLEMRWSEVDLHKAMLVVPAARMKAGVEFRQPLSNRAIEILRHVEIVKREDDWVWPGQRKGRPLSVMAMLMLLKGSHPNYTVHGFRSSFSDYITEQTSFSSETREQCLAHRISDKAEAAYRRGDQLDKRRTLLQHWADYCSGKLTGNVVSLHGHGNIASD